MNGSSTTPDLLYQVTPSSCLATRSGSTGQVYETRVELKCDGIAGLTLVALNLDLSSLHNGIRTMTDFNAQLGATAGADGYPSLRERRTFIETLLKDFQRRRTAWWLATSHAMRRAEL
jgi:hypothetical protein